MTKCPQRQVAGAALTLGRQCLQRRDQSAPDSGPVTNHDDDDDYDHHDHDDEYSINPPQTQPQIPVFRSKVRF